MRKDCVKIGKGLSDAKLVSLTKKECDFAVQLMSKFIKVLKSISDRWLIEIWWGFCLSGTSRTKQCHEFSLIFLGP